MNTSSSLNLELNEDLFQEVQLKFPSLNPISLSIEQVSSLVRIPLIYHTEYWLRSINGKKGALPCINEYEVIKCIGSGAYCKVWEFIDLKTFQKYAAKNYSEIICSKNRSMRYYESGEELITEYEKVWMEILCNMLLDNPFIAKLHKIIFSPERRMFYLIFEHLPYNCLKWDCSRQCYTIPLDSIEHPMEIYEDEFLIYSEDGALHIFRQIFQAVLFCHQKSIIHKDIKPENILLNRPIPQHFIHRGQHSNLTTHDLATNKVNPEESGFEIESELYLWDDAPCYDEYQIESHLKKIDKKANVNKVTIMQLFSATEPYPKTSRTQKIERTQVEKSHLNSVEQFNTRAREEIYAKLLDFNSAEIVQNPDCRIYDAEGTSSFSPPETLALLSQGGVNGTARDIWSLGCFLYTLVYGILPFKGYSSIEIYSEMMNSPLKFPSWRPISKYLSNLISSMLIIDPSARINMQLLETLLNEKTP